MYPTWEFQHKNYMQKIKVLHIIKSLGRGGAEVLLPETLKLHNKSKFEFHYIYFLPWKDQMVEALEEAGGKTNCFSASSNIKMMQLSFSVARYCTRNSIDVIHCHLPWSGFVGRIVHRKIGIPMIYTEHNIQERYHLLTKFLNKVTFNSQCLALGVSEDVSRSIKENINPKIPVETLLNGVNTSFFKRDEQKGKLIRESYNIPEDKLVIGNIAVFRQQKDLSTWVRTFKKINKDHPDVYGLLVGAGPEEAGIKALVKELNLEGRIKFSGLQTDTISYFSAMDIFLMTSAFEGLPIALLEAMSMNCAIVSTRAGGVKEVVRDGKDGILCKIGDVQELSLTTKQLITDEEELKKFQHAARGRVEESFSLAKMVKSIENIYQKILVK